MGKLTFDVTAQHYREIKAARRAGVDVVIIPADKYARLMRREAVAGQLDLVELLAKASENPKMAKHLDGVAAELKRAIEILETAVGPETDRGAA